MILALILIKVESSKEQAVYNRVRELPNVKEAHILLGVYDISVQVEFKDPGELTDFVINKLRKIPGVVDTRTLPSVRYDKISR